jgi:hypothetical protein
MIIPKMYFLRRGIQKFMASGNFGKFGIITRIPTAVAARRIIINSETKTGRANNGAFAAFNANLP